ncbi:MAG: flagellar brake domain-containing protein [candidate division Zixibacteria bacterium]|nr:flagellar brake domain-containing protein [candidate division Zixibacteria bacterium]
MVELTLPKLVQPLVLWEKLELVVGEGIQAGHYTTRIEDFNGRAIVVSPPEFVGGHTLLSDRAEVMILITRDDAIYQCHSRITRYPAGEKKLFLLAPPQGIKRVQRRQFVRVEAFERIEYARIINLTEWEEREDLPKWCQSITSDISGGGVLMKTDENTKPGDLLLLKIGVFPEQDLPEIIAAICRRVFTLDDQVMAGMEFLTANRLTRHFGIDDLKRLPRRIQDFNRGVQNHLVNYVFQRQIELRQKGLL